LIDKRFLDGWQKYWYEWQCLIDEWKKGNVENCLVRAYVEKDV
jgi:hypothetical protein